MDKSREVMEFTGRQGWKLFCWFLTCFFTAYVLSWIVGTVVEVAVGGDAISPMWILEVF